MNSAISINVQRSYNKHLFKTNVYHQRIHYHGDHLQYNTTKTNVTEFDEHQFIDKLLTKYNELKHTLTPIEIGTVNSFQEIESIYLDTHKNKTKLKHCKQIQLIIYYIDNIIKSLNLGNNYFLFNVQVKVVWDQCFIDL